MNPLRWDVLGVAFLLSLPLLALGLRGDMTAQEVATRLPWCFLAGWGAVSLLHWASRPRTPAPPAPAEKQAGEEEQPQP